MSAHIAVLNGMNRYEWNWKLSDIVQDKDVTVFSTFSCGGAAAWGTKEQALRFLGM